MKMTATDLYRYWRALFDETPSIGTLETFAKFASIGPVYADELLALLIESSTQFFSSEGSRVLWIAQSIAGQNDATPVTLRAA